MTLLQEILPQACGACRAFGFTIKNNVEFKTKFVESFVILMPSALY